MSDDRCFGCCQENCMSGQERCSCSCHGRSDVQRAILPRGSLVPCPACGIFGAHYCAGGAVGRVRAWRQEEAHQLRQATVDSGRCPDHRRYQAKRAPRTTCESCWRIWISLNPR